MTPLPPFLSPEKTRFLPVPEDLLDAFHPAKLCLFEWSDYWFEWRGATHLRVGEELVEPFAPNLFRVRWENTLGASAIQPFRGEDAIDVPLSVEILSPKFPTPHAHLDFFRALLHDLFDRAARLLFHFEGETARGVDFSDLAPTPLWTRLFLEQHGARLREALRHFLAQPCHELETERLWLDASGATHFDGAALRATARESRVWTRHNSRLQPSRVAQNRAFEPIDTPKNRFVAAFARRLFQAIAEREGDNFREISGLCAAVSTRFPFWNEEIRPSPTLERHRVSRELLHLWRLWRGAGTPIFAHFERAARLRDIAQLYEFWAFFALADAIAEALHQTPRLQTVGDESRGLAPLSRAQFEKGTLVFNGPAPSYSTPLRPDFLWLENGTATLAFDAKFRLENGESESRGRGADLHKMHAYRDALGVRGAIAIYPGETSRFFHQNGGKTAFSPQDLWSGAAQGVGVWALRPDLTKTAS